MDKLFLLIGLMLAVALFTACALKPVRVEGTAMLSTFDDGDRVLMDENLGALKRGEIVMFLYPKDTSKWYLKRIVGLPGEKLEIRAGKVYVNDQPLDEPYLDENYNQQKPTFPPLVIPVDHYYVLGDNRDNSSDSRYWGTVSKDLIKRKYYMTY